MTTLICDFQDIVGERINGYATLSAGEVRIGQDAPTVVLNTPSSPEQVIEGEAIFENVEPGAAILQLHWNRKSATLRFTVPNTPETVTLSECIEKTLDYTPPVISRSLELIESARVEALGDIDDTTIAALASLGGSTPLGGEKLDGLAPDLYSQADYTVASTDLGYPTDNSAWIIRVENIEGTAVNLQTAVSVQAGRPPVMWERRVSGGVGGQWSMVGHGPVDLDTTDLNDVRRPGTYSQPDAADATLERNYPKAGANGVLIVSPSLLTSGTVIQTYTIVDISGKRITTVSRWINDLEASPWENASVQTVEEKFATESVLGWKPLGTQNLNELGPGRWGQPTVANVTTDRGYPVSQGLWLIEVDKVNSDGSTLRQRATKVSPGAPNVTWERRVAGGVAEAWVMVGHGAMDLIADNLNTVLTPGEYQQVRPANATLAQNYPVAGGVGTMIVQAVPLSNTMLVQTFTAVNIAAQSVRTFKRWVRSGGAETSPWTEIGVGGGGTPVELSIGTVTSSDTGSSASITDGVLDLTIQRGLPGERGQQGEQGPAGPAAAEALPQIEAVAGWANDPQTELSAAIDRVALRHRGTIPLSSRRDVMTRFQAGHGWTLGGAGTWGIGDSPWGQSAQLTTDGAGGVGTAETYFPVKDMSTGSLVLWIQADDPDNVPLLQVQLQVEGSWTKLWQTPGLGHAERLLMRNSKWTPHTLEPTFGNLSWQRGGTSAATFDQITGIRIRIQDAGTTPNTVRLGGVELHHKPARWPDGAIIIGFDDGYLNQKLAQGVMDEFGFPGTHYIVKELVGARGGSNDFLDLQDLKDMQHYSGWDIQHHAYSNNVHASTYAGVSAAVLDRDLREGKRWGKKHGFDYEHLAYPQGVFNDDVVEVVRQYFATARTTIRHPRSTYGPYRPYELSGEITRGNTPVDPTLTQAIASTKASGLPNEIIFHRFEEGTGASADSIGYTTGRLREFCQAIKDAGVPVITRAEAHNR